MVNIFDIGVLCCKTIGHAEGISNAILEYMALEKPVIATNSGGNDEIVVHNHTGFIISPFNVDNLVSKIEFLLSNPEVRSKMGREGKKKVIREFSIDRLVNSFSKLYVECIKR